MILQKSVLLLKSQKDSSNDKYEDILVENDFDVIIAKTLVFNFRNLDVLANKLEDYTCFEGLIFSSPRCVQATYLSDKDRKLLQFWHDKQNFVVGEATYKDAYEKLNLECRGKNTGNALKLSQLILEGNVFMLFNWHS